mmetsp:Transcript_68480/g.193167  ORF Transcript_68480/g.193167 Transcript_68480/m.193167 type:complete len:354 (-) Transcript_68480:426-1487(-)
MVCAAAALPMPPAASGVARGVASAGTSATRACGAGAAVPVSTMRKRIIMCGDPWLGARRRGAAARHLAGNSKRTCCPGDRHAERRSSSACTSKRAVICSSALSSRPRATTESSKGAPNLETVNVKAEGNSTIVTLPACSTASVRTSLPPSMRRLTWASQPAAKGRLPRRIPLTSTAWTPRPTRPAKSPIEVLQSPPRLLTSWPDRGSLAPCGCCGGCVRLAYSGSPRRPRVAWPAKPGPLLSGCGGAAPASCFAPSVLIASMWSFPRSPDFIELYRHTIILIHAPFFQAATTKTAAAKSSTRWRVVRTSPTPTPSPGKLGILATAAVKNATAVSLGATTRPAPSSCGASLAAA